MTDAEALKFIRDDIDRVLTHDLEGVPFGPEFVRILHRTLKEVVPSNRQFVFRISLPIDGALSFDITLTGEV